MAEQAGALLADLVAAHVVEHGHPQHGHSVVAAMLECTPVACHLPREPAMGQSTIQDEHRKP